MNQKHNLSEINTFPERKTVKTYFCTNTLETNFPPEFINSIGRKWIVVRGCVATINNGYIVSDLALHADFIYRDAYLDHFVNFVNNIDSGSKHDKYEYPANGKKTFNVWFTDIQMNPVEVDAFVLKLLLIYETN